MKDIQIRNMKEKDIDEISELERLSFKTPWSRKSFEEELENKVARYIVAEAAGKVIGYCGVWIIVDEGHITNVAVHPDYRGQGIGKMLVEHLIALCKDEEVYKLTLEVNTNNTVAQGLYQSFGFESQGVRKGYYTDTNEDAMIMWYMEEREEE